MDDSYEDLELELKSLPLRRPSDEVMRRIGHDLTESSRPYRTATNLDSFKWFGWQTIGLAGVLVAVVTGLSLSRLNQPSIPAPGNAASPVTTTRPVQSQPVSASNVLYDLKDEGPVTTDGATPSRRIRYRYVDTYTLKSPQRNASLKWSVPRDEIRVVPASLD